MDLMQEVNRRILKKKFSGPMSMFVNPTTNIADAATLLNA